MASGPALDKWTGRDVSVAEIERQLAELRSASQTADHGSDLRTSVMTHIAWVPDDWLGAAHEVLAGLAERHPSRTIVLVPKPDSKRDALDADVSLQCFPLGGSSRHVCTETIELRLLGDRALAPGSIVQPLLVSDLPVFCRWRGEPPWGADEFEQLVGIVDRLVVDSGEWAGVPESYARFWEVFDRVAVSDIAWSRTLPWRRALAALWPAIVEAGELRVEGPEAEAVLLAAWLGTRLGQELELVHDPLKKLRAVAVDGEAIELPRSDGESPADLLSNELDRFSRDPVYEEAARAAASGVPEV